MRNVLLIAAAVVVTEVLAAGAVCLTLGAVLGVGLLLFIIVPVNTMIVPFFLLGRRPAAIPLFALWVVIVPWNIYQAVQLWRVQTEVERMVEWADDYHARLGVYPGGLEDYAFRDPGIQDGVYSLHISENDYDYTIRYGIPMDLAPARNAAYWYNSRWGWGYDVD